VPLDRASLARSALIALLLLAAYSPALTRQYGLSDDYPAVAKRLVGSTAERDNMLQGGRPTLAVVADLAFGRVRSVAGLRILRLVGVLGIALLACGLERALRRAGLAPAEALLAALAITTTPPFQVLAAWAVTFPYAFAAALAGRALLLADGARAAGPAWRRAAEALTAALWLLLVVTLYQPAACFFWVFAAIALMRPRATDRGRRLLAYGAISGAAFALGYLVFRASLVAFRQVGTDDRSRLVSDFGGKLRWFLLSPLTDALNLHALLPSRALALAVALVLCVGLWRGADGRPARRASRLLLAAALLPLAYLPNLVVEESSSSYRTELALTSLVGVFLVLALAGLLGPAGTPMRRALPLLLGAWAAVGLLSAGVHVERYFAGPQARERAFILQRLAAADLDRHRSLYVIPALEGRSLAPALRKEFGMLTASLSWAVLPEVSLALREVRPEHASMRMFMTPPGVAPLHPRGSFVLDLRSLGRPAR
jgi:Glucosyl transferase GtrII